MEMAAEMTEGDVAPQSCADVPVLAAMTLLDY